jgi:hypothetical protein
MSKLIAIRSMEKPQLVHADADQGPDTVCFKNAEGEVTKISSRLRLKTTQNNNGVGFVTLREIPAKVTDPITGKEIMTRKVQVWWVNEE